MKLLDSPMNDLYNLIFKIINHIKAGF